MRYGDDPGAYTRRLEARSRLGRIRAMLGVVTQELIEVPRSMA
jgi:hypothetical protein